MQDTIKNVIKTYVFYSLITLSIILIVENIIFPLKFSYSICYLIGLIISLVCFLITSLSVNRVTSFPEGRVKFITIGAYFIRLFIYALSLYFVFKYINEYGVFTCFFGFLSIRICIYLKFTIFESFEDKRRSVDKLKIDNSIKAKLKVHGIYKTSELVLYDKERLNFLNEYEIDKIINALKEYGLFIKGELEVIKEDDDSNNTE